MRNEIILNSNVFGVHGQEVIWYTLKRQLFVESFERAFIRLSQRFGINMHENIIYLDLKDVMIYDIENGFVNCNRIIQKSNTDQWVSLRLTGGRCLLATVDQEMIINGNEKTSLINLKLKDTIKISKEFPNVSSIQYDTDKAYMMGIILCDGNYNGDISVALGYDELDIVNKYVEIVSNNFKSKVKVTHINKAPKKYTDITFANKQFINFLCSFFEGFQKINRHIANEVFSWDIEAKLSFLAGMIDGDGSLAKKHCKRLRIGSTNKELALQQFFLIQSLGYNAKFYLNRYCKQNPNKIGFITEFYPDKNLLEHVASGKKKDLFKIGTPRCLEFGEVKGILNICKNIEAYSVQTDTGMYMASGIQISAIS